MKKIIFAILLAMLILSGLHITAFAQTPYVTFSQDYDSLTIQDTAYTCIDSSQLIAQTGESLNYPIRLTPEQMDSVMTIHLETTPTQNIIYADIQYKNGALLSAYYLQNDYMDTYNQLISGNANSYVIDFVYPDGNTIEAERNELITNDVLLKSAQLEWCDYYYIYKQNNEASLSIAAGALIIIDEDYYYVDFEEVGVDDWSYFYPDNYAELPAHKITNSDLCAKISAGEEAYYKDDSAWLFGDGIDIGIITIMVIAVLFIVPIALLITFIILAIRSKGIYKKLFRALYVLSIATIIASAFLLYFS